jgi:hypothetical protein
LPAPAPEIAVTGHDLEKMSALFKYIDTDRAASQAAFFAETAVG